MSIELRLKVSNRLDKFELRCDIDRALRPVTALFGPSGAGKTTLLEIIAGFQRGTGTVSFGDDIWESESNWVPPWQRGIATVFQHSALFSHLDVAGNIQYAERRAADRPGLNYKQLITSTNLEPLLHRHVESLSGGERKRVALARSLASRPQLLLLDEPFAGLDARARGELIALLRNLAESAAVPVILVSHDIDDIVALADDIICLESGEVRASGALNAVYPQLDRLLPPEKTGSIIEATVRQCADNGLMALAIGEQEICISDAGDLEKSQTVRLRVQTRDVVLAREAVTGISIRNQLSGRVEKVSPADKGHVHVTLSCEGQTLRADITAQSLAELDLEPGDGAWMLIKSVAIDWHPV